MEVPRFQLVRDKDVTGVSGTGIVADGVLWPDGSVSIRWRGERTSIVYWHTLEDAKAVHSHGGATRFVWLDRTCSGNGPDGRHRFVDGQMMDCLCGQFQDGAFVGRQGL